MSVSVQFLCELTLTVFLNAVINFLSYALKSGNESKYWLELSKDLDQNLTKEIDYLLKETDEIVKILGSSIVKLKLKK